MLHAVQKAITDAGLNVVEAELSYVPNITVTIEDVETARKVFRLMDALDDLDDVAATHSNFDIAQDVEV